MKNKILVTGGAGFIGSEFVRQGVKRGHKIVVVDKLTYAGDLARLKELEGKYKFYRADIAHFSRIKSIFDKENPGIVIHFAAETHVDRSIHEDAGPFIQTNVQGIQNLINVSRLAHVKKFIHISTDEVYGEILKGKFTETSPLRPNNPYSATKASADHLIQAAIRTYNLPAIIVRPSNNYGPWQYPEKLVPVVILKALSNQRVPVYAKGKNVREWLFVSDCAAAIHLIAQRGKIGEIYNVGSTEERTNIETVKKILKKLRKPESLIEFVKDRPGHDRRYSLNWQKIQKLGWQPKINFETGIAYTVEWNIKHLSWLRGKKRLLESYWKKVYKK